MALTRCAGLFVILALREALKFGLAQGENGGERWSFGGELPKFLWWFTDDYI
jgi:hypothetical protein